MALDPGRIKERLDDVVAAVRAAVTYDQNGDGGIQDAVLARLVHTRCLATIERFAPPDSIYRSELASIDDGHVAWRAQEAGAIVQALRDDYALGGLETVAELVHADLFDDFLEMARELHGKGFVGPAAMVAGSVLEEHLRKLADRSQIARRDANGSPKSVETLGVELRKKNVFSEVQRKALQAWYAMRTEAAHGRFDALIGSDVERMIDGIRDFVARHAA